MRFRFSLRTLLLLTGGLAGFCYYWVVMPTATAKWFVRSIHSEDYTAADRLFWNKGDRVLAEWNEQRWGFQSDADLAPWSLGQLVTGRRDLLLHLKYFQFDENHEIEMRIAATSFGLRPPRQGFTTAAMLIDDAEAVSIRR